MKNKIEHETGKEHSLFLKEEKKKDKLAKKERKTKEKIKSPIIS